MRMHMFVGLIIIAASAGTLAQTTGSKEDAKKPITLVGCVQPSTGAPNQYNFADDGTPKSLASYRLSGASMKKYAGKRVEIVGVVVSNRLKVAGGLLPSPNAAAQAGAMDPARAAIAGGAGGTASGTGNVELPEFRVKSVRPVAGSCEQQQHSDSHARGATGTAAGYLPARRASRIDPPASLKADQGVSRRLRRFRRSPWRSRSGRCRG